MKRTESLQEIQTDIRRIAYSRYEGCWNWARLHELSDRVIDESGEIAVNLGKPGIKTLRKVLAIDGLKALYIDDCRKLNPRGLSELSTVDGLTELSLVWAKLDKMDTLRFSPSIELLDLNGVQPHPQLSDALKALPKLKHLDLSYVELDPGIFPELSELETVKLRGWKALPIRALAQCKRLCEVGGWGVPTDTTKLSMLEGSPIRQISTSAETAPALLDILALEAISFGGVLTAALSEALSKCRSLCSISTSSAVSTEELELLLSLPKLRSLSVGSMAAEATAQLGKHPRPLNHIAHGLLPDNTSPPGLATPIVQRDQLHTYGATNWHPDPELAEAIVASPSLQRVFLRFSGRPLEILTAGGWEPRCKGLWYVAPSFDG